MNINKRLIAFILILCLTTGLFTACGSEPAEEEEIDYDFSVFFGGMDDAIEIDAMLTEYEKTTGIKINPIIISENEDNNRALKSILGDEDSPAAYAASSDEGLEWLSGGGFIADFATIDPDVQGNNLPYKMDGYGFAYDRTMFTEMFGKDSATQLISDLRKADYQEWTIFVDALNNYINNRLSENFSIGGNVYKFPGEKGKLTKDMNGVFALPGADSNVYGYNVINPVMQTVDLSAWEGAKNELSGSALQTLNPALTTYTDGLDLMTSYLCGDYSSGIRGTDFINGEYYSNEQTESMFMTGKSMFAIIDSREYTKLEEMNAKKALSLEYLPIKMPYDASLGGKSSEGAVLNSSIPAEIAYSLYVNGNHPKEIQKEALDFILWFTAQEDKWVNSLSASIKTYVKSNSILDYDYAHDELASWEEEIFGEKGVRVFLRKELWNQEYKNEMKLYLTKTWCES